MDAADVVFGLSGDPESLLRHCYLRVAGGDRTPPPNGTAPISTFRVWMLDGSIQGFTTRFSGFRRQTKARPQAQIEKMSGVARTHLQPNQFNAYYIPMVQVSDVAAGHSHYTLPTNDPNGPVIAITSMITACTFTLGSDVNGAILASHIQPPRAVGMNLSARLYEAAKAGHSGLESDIQQIGLGDGYGEGDKVTIIGRLTRRRWTFYMQRTSFLGCPKGLLRSAARIVELE